jgi:hypothetical protein|tara:strand:+ start:136 stop:1413 length:1278 start_codon:yes stop_codon:yes gene_type:complete
MIQKKLNQENYLKFYLGILAALSIFWLHQKSSTGNDSTISEWIINYQGGFTRRGLPGEIAFHIAKIFDVKLRFVIFIFQSTTYILYLYLIYYFFRKIKLNLIFSFAFFTPIFLIYHLAELEVLARKELFMFIGMIWFYEISKRQSGIFKPSIWLFCILPLVTILYEPTAFYYPFFAAIIVIKLRNEKIIKTFFIITLIFIPSLIASWFSAFELLSDEGFEIMKNSLQNNFGEACYMSCGLMGSKKEAIIHISHTIQKLHEGGSYSIYIYLFRYFIIMLVGFLPLLIIINFSKIKIKILKFKNLIFPFLILNSLVPLHWLMFLDWGRAVNITYVSSFLFIFYLYKNTYIYVNLDLINKKIAFILEVLLKYSFFKSKKKLTVFIFIIYAFGWSPPTLLSADVNSFPGYRIPYKTIKYALPKIKNFFN